jgi:hypothetical protein
MQLVPQRCWVNECHGEGLRGDHDHDDHVYSAAIGDAEVGETHFEHQSTTTRL